MKIEKEYNIEQLAEQLLAEIENSKKYNRVVKLDILTANDILDVLNETNKREQKHQTLESVCNFMEMEDGTQTNEMKLHNEKDANGNILRSIDCHLEELEDNRNCFGYCVEDDYTCTHCADYEKCKKETDKIKSRGDKVEANSKPERNETLCDDCLMKSCCKVDCTHEHITEQMLGDLKKCFGKSYGKRIVACGTCKYKEQCMVLTKHE